MPVQLHQQHTPVDRAFASFGHDTGPAVLPAAGTAQESTPTKAPAPSRARFAEHAAVYGLLTDPDPTELICDHARDRNQQIQPVTRVPPETYSLAQVKELSQMIGETLCQFEIGQSSLQRSLMSPPVKLDLARARQGAVGKKQADTLYLEQWRDIWSSFPQVSTACARCSSTDISGEITPLITRAQRMSRVARQAAQILRQARRGRLSAEERELTSATGRIYDRFVQATQALPKVSSVCR